MLDLWDAAQRERGSGSIPADIEEEIDMATKRVIDKATTKALADVEGLLLEASRDL